MVPVLLVSRKAGLYPWMAVASIMLGFTLESQLALSSESAMEPLFLADTDLALTVYRAQMILGFLALLACAFAALWVVRNTGRLVIAWVSLAMFAASFVPFATGNDTGSPPERMRLRPGGSHLPNILHIVLDEHMALGAFPTEIAGSAEAEGAARRFYEEHGFRTYYNSFSHYRNTDAVMASLMNFDTRSDPSVYLGGNNRLIDNAYFKKLSDRGYSINLYHSGWIRYERTQGIEFGKVVVGKSIERPIALVDGAATLRERVTFRIHALLRKSRMLRKVLSVYRRTVSPRLSRLIGTDTTVHLKQYTFGARDAFRILEEVLEDLEVERTGQIFFLHLMIPHSSYFLDTECAIAPYGEWRSSYMAASRRSEPTSKTDREKTYEAYFRQVRCTYHSLEAFFDRADEAGLLSDATVLIHGDHGSRIVDSLPGSQRYGAAEARHDADWFAAHFAYRQPGVEAERIHSVISIHRIFAQLFSPETELDSRPFVRYTEGYRSHAEKPYRGGDLAETR